MNEKTGLKEIFGLLARLAVGGVFVYSGVIKALASPEEFAYAIESYKVIGAAPALWAAYVVPWVELYAGLLLAAGVFTRWSGLFTGAMLVFFELLLAQALLRGLPVTSCGCFGAAGSNSLAHEFLQNLVFLALLWPALFLGRGLSADALVEEE
ncbi:MAG TPA: DoxX family protein [Elusimicrobiales bacterium]|nr:DoxX family protein [Elusimicrobiales bacterium]